VIRTYSINFNERIKNFFCIGRKKIYHIQLLLNKVDLKKKKEREEKAARKKAWSNRKRFPKRDPISSEIYNLLMKESEGPSYIGTRTRIALCLLTVTGIRIGELLPLKVGQLETLLEQG